jgi:hypothetical protein
MTHPTQPPNEPPPPLPAGWYDDPFTDELQRYWDGTSWTKQTRPREPQDPITFGSAGISTLTKAIAPPVAESQPVIIRDYLLWSIITLIFCFWPLAIPAVYFSVRCMNARNKGDIQEALRYSDRARLFVLLSVVGGLVVLGWIVVSIISGGSGGLGL